MNRVAIDKCERYEEEAIRHSFKNLIANTDFPDVEGKSILIKPNILSDSDPEKNITTNPLLVKVFIQMLHEMGADKIYLGDSPGLPGPSFSGRISGFEAVCQETGAIWSDFSSNPVERTIYKNIKVPMARILFDVDLVFSICKMKTHQLMYATGAVKNMFGTVPGLNKSPLHLKARSPEEFAKLILSIYRERIPDYSIMDGIISMEGAGPSNGDLRHTALLLSSKSALALDRAEALIMGYNPDDIPILRQAEIDVKGSTDASYPLLDPNDIAIKDFKRIEIKKRGLFNSLLLPFVTKHFPNKDHRKAPIFNSEKCRLCKKCINICPAKALQIENGKVVIDTKKCIKCYCCHEMCPFDAIEVK